MKLVKGLLKFSTYVFENMFFILRQRGMVFFSTDIICDKPQTLSEN